MSKIFFINKNNVAEVLVEYLENKFLEYKIVFLVDNNSNKHCFESVFLSSFIGVEYEVIEIESGEENKTIETCSLVWDIFTEYEFNKKTLLIVIGGGVLCDLGAFVATNFKRGLPFILVPTTLLAMVDASIGGKCGVNFKNFKNQIGLFSNSKATFVDSIFLKTLNNNELICGLAEMIKHALIKDINYWNEILKINLDNIKIQDIKKACKIKIDIVKKDPYEKNERKLLNFGHTFAHAIENLCLTENKQISHGEAVLIGMIYETKLSVLFNNLNKSDSEHIISFIKQYVSIPVWSEKQKYQIIKSMKQDKKNENKLINFTLLKNIGNAEIDFYLTEYQILEIF